MSGLTREEQDFARWMEELDLEEVNLLDEQKPDQIAVQAPTAAERERLSGEREKVELPDQRGVGWD